MSVLRAARRLSTALLVLGVASAAGRAQGVDCDSLRQQLAALTRADPGRDARFVRAIEQQRSELARTQAYADSIGCGGFNFFGDTPAQCGTIENRISRMQANLDSLENQARTLRNGSPEQAQDLEASYDHYCRPAPGQDDALVYNDPGLMPEDGSQTGEQPDQASRGGDKAICVRTCDGGFFPLSTGVRSDDLGGLQALCSAQCPNTEAKLYTTGDTDNISGAVAVDGTSYSELPNAFKFTKAHDAACTCKPPGQTWVQALAKAEDLLDKSQANDVTVTEKMSADMARPVQPAPAPAKKTGKRDRRGGFDLPPPPAVPSDVALGALAAQAPTASTASAGIAAAGKAPTPVVHADEGAVKTVTGPDGTSRRVRIIGPGL